MYNNTRNDQAHYKRQEVLDTFFPELSGPDPKELDSLMMDEDYANYENFKNRVDHNTLILENAIRNGICLSTIVSSMYTWDTNPGKLHFSEIQSLSFDVIPCAFLGALANTKRTGADGFIVKEDGSLNPIEVKTSLVDTTKLWKGANGGLYFGKGKKPTEKVHIRSNLKASYNCHTTGNLESKEMDTYLLVGDTSGRFAPNSYVDAWYMDGKPIVEYLRRSDQKSRTIKLGSFMKEGRQAETTVPLDGVYKWFEFLQKVSPDKDTYMRENGYP